MQINAKISNIAFFLVKKVIFNDTTTLKPCIIL